MRKEIAPEILADIAWFEENLRKYRAGELTEDGFSPLRLHMGVYGQRQGEENQMFRTKIPYGGLDAEKLRAIADIAEKFGGGKAHVTTRQNFQIHYVKLDNIVEVMKVAGEADITSREACSNTIRNVVGCPFSGVCPSEAFDATPHAHALVHFFLRNPDNQALPRKFKISFSSCPYPCPNCRGAEPVPHIQDIAFIAKVVDGKRGFEVWIGGGLGNTPKFAQLLEDFTPQQDYLRTAEAIVKVFNTYGERKNRNRARMKFLIQSLGWDEFRKRVLQTRQELPLRPLNLPKLDETPKSSPVPFPEPADPHYLDWKLNNVLWQRQPGYSSVTALLPIGDITPPQLRGLADVAEKYADGYVRSSPNQNLILRWVRNENLPVVYTSLRSIGLAEPTANTIQDVTTCPGASTCKIAFTNSKNLGTALRETMAAGNGIFHNLPLQVKVSGCPNSCGQHHVADVGFYGMTRKVGEYEVPVYNILVQGGITKGVASYGAPIGKVPARLAPVAFKRIVEFYRTYRQGPESFYDFVTRVTVEPLKKLIEDLVNWKPEGDLEPLKDIGVDEVFKSKIMQGECAK